MGPWLRAKLQRLGVVAVVLGLLYVMQLAFFARFSCVEPFVEKEMAILCELYKRGEAIGSMCAPLCDDHDFRLTSCSPEHSVKAFPFPVRWKDRVVVFKSAFAFPERLLNETGDPGGYGFSRWVTVAQDEYEPVVQDRYVLDKEEEEMERAIRQLVEMTTGDRNLTNLQVESLRFINPDDKWLYSNSAEGIMTEMRNAYALAQSKEYLLPVLYKEKNLFPQVLGTCGYVFAVESSGALDYGWKAQGKPWVNKYRQAVAIMDILEELSTGFSDPLYLCEVRNEDFGINSEGRVQYLNLGNVYSKVSLNEGMILPPCRGNFDCRGATGCSLYCDNTEHLCLPNKLPDNLQMACKTIFLGQTVTDNSDGSGDEGLLVSNDTAHPTLMKALRTCANHPGPIPRSERDNLYQDLLKMTANNTSESR